MKVIKAAPGAVRASQSVIQKAQDTIGEAGRGAKGALEASVIGEEEEQAREKAGKGGRAPGRGPFGTVWQSSRPKGNKSTGQRAGSSQGQTLPGGTWHEAMEKGLGPGSIQTETASKKAEAAAGNKRRRLRGAAAHTAKAPAGSMGGMPTGSMGGMPAGSMGGMPVGSMGGIPGRGTAGMPAGSMSRMPGRGAAGMPTGSMSRVPGRGTGRMPAGRTASQTAVKAASQTAATAAKTAGKAATATAGAAATAATSGGAAAVKAAVSAATAAAKAAVGMAKKMDKATDGIVSGKEGQKGAASGQKGGQKGIAVLIFGVLAGLVILMTSSFLLWQISEEQKQTGAADIVAAARQEIEASDDNIGGMKYKKWYGLDADWCVMFLCWCANECGYIESGIIPRTASVAYMESWYKDQQLYHTRESGYVPKAGDIIFFSNGGSHAGLVLDFDDETSTIITGEGNTGNSGMVPYHKGSRVKEKRYPLTYTRISGYGTPRYPAQMIDIPEPFGTEYSYMGWQVITSKTSLQYKLREEAGMNFDANGFGVIENRYVIACTLKFGSVGDYIDWELEDGTIIPTVVGDIKNEADPGCNEWGHHNGLNVIEFVVDKSSWYGTDKYPTDFFPEWGKRAVRAFHRGSYWKQEELNADRNKQGY